MTLYTIGFAGHRAVSFFEKLRSAGVIRVIDTRLSRSGQLSGFAKYPDIAYFLERLAGASYEVAESLAPLPTMLRAYKAKQLNWDDYEEQYIGLLQDRGVSQDESLRSRLDKACLLCSEHVASRCHRRVAAEFLKRTLEPKLSIVHL